jgi:PKD repeat protein
MTKKITSIKNNASILKFAFLLGIIVLSSQIKAQYCASAATSTADSDIATVYMEGNTVKIDYTSPTPNCDTYTDNTGETPIDITAGSTYTISVRYGACGSFYYNHQVMVWIDYNQNFAFEADEAVRSSATQGSATNLFETKYTWTVPCNVKSGFTRMRIVLIEGTIANPGSACGSYTWGETIDYTAKVELPTGLATNFIIPQTIYTNTPVTFFNGNKTGFISHQWDLGLDGYDFTGLNFTRVFTTPGTYSLKLRSSNCNGIDSIVKSFNVQTPPFAPLVDFISNKTVVEDGDEITLYDLSDYGPNNWSWELEDPNNPFSFLDNSNIIGGASYLGSYYRAVFEMSDVGSFNTKLSASNSQGTSSRNKANYITVNPFSEFWLGAGANSTEIGKGKIFDKGGPTGNYSTGNNGDPSVNRLRIQPCGAEEISLNITQFKFTNASHNLKIWDGPNATAGTPLHPSGGFNKDNTKAPLTIVAKSGSMYLELDTRAAGLTDSGLIATFTTKYGPTGPPSPKFELAEQTIAYTKAPIKIKSKSLNIYGLASYTWTVNGNSALPSQLADENREFTYNFPTAGDYEVCLDISSCTGDGSFCDTIKVIDPTTPTNLDFTTSSFRPSLNEVVTLTSTSDKADRFLWSISPLSHSFQPGFNRTSKNPKVTFAQTGCYTVNLRAWNSLDSSATVKTLIKDAYICVIDPCIPSAGILSSDVSNSFLEIKDANGNVIYFNNSTEGVVDYESFMDAKDLPIELYFGATYSVRMGRSTTADPVSRAVYIDYNISGNFTNNERVLFEINTQTNEAFATFTVPSINQSFSGNTRLRTVVNYGSNPAAPCGPALIGEYEDHRVVIKQSTKAPVINLIGLDTLRIEQGSSYADAGAIALDAIEGDISSDMVITSDLDSSQPGIYFVKYEVTNASGLKAAPKTRWILVTIDQTAPVLSLVGNQNDTVEVNTTYVDLGATAIDAVDGNISAAITVIGSVNTKVLGTYVLTYTVMDAQGNKSTIQRNVVVADRTAPEIVFIGTENVQLGSFWFDQTFVRDNYWSESNIVFTKTYGFAGPVRWDTKGEYPVTYSATDASGNNTTITKTYIVEDFIAPVIALNTNDTVIHEVRTKYNSIAPTVTDNYYSNSNISFNRVSTVNENVLGKYTETFRAIDGSGNLTTKTRWVKVIDTKAPIIYAAPICSKLGIDFNPLHGLVIEDNYYSQAELLPLVEIRESNVNPFSVGKYNAVYSVVDPSGNKSGFVWRNIEISEACELVTSVNQVEMENLIQVMPNPTTGKFVLSLSKESNVISNVEVLNSVGSVILSKQSVANSIEFDMTGQAVGVYFVKVQLGGQILTKRIIVQD